MIVAGHLWRSRVFSIAMASTLAACVTNYEHVTADERLLHEQSDSFVSENVFGGAGTGAFLGAVAGAFLGAAFGGNAKSVGYGAAAGAIGGAIIGGVDGYLQAKEARYQANLVLMERSVAADVRSDNQRLSQLLQTSSRVVEADKQKLGRLQAQVAARQVTLDRARAEAAAVRENSGTIEETLKNAREKRDNYVDARNHLGGGVTGELDMEIRQLNNEIEALEQQVAALNASLELTGLEK